MRVDIKWSHVWDWNDLIPSLIDYVGVVEAHYVEYGAVHYVYCVKGKTNNKVFFRDFGDDKCWFSQIKIKIKRSWWQKLLYEPEYRYEMQRIIQQEAEQLYPKETRAIIAYILGNKTQ